MNDMGEWLRKQAEKAVETAKEGIKPPPTLAEEAMRLREAYALFATKHEFKPGMIIRQKPGIKVYDTYGINDICIVVEVLKEPIYDNKEKHGSTYFRMPLDMVIGSICKSSELITFHVDSRRFEPVPLDDIKPKGLQ